MGTNYYCETGREIEVECDCGFKHMMKETLHIGKNSYGWKFALHVMPEKGLMCWKDWEPVLLSAKRIFDEYGDDTPFDELKELILHKKNRKLSKEDKEKMRKLARENFYILDENCWLFGGETGRPQGTDGNYGMIMGEFS